MNINVHINHPIKVGDVCEIVAHETARVDANARRYLGQECTVERLCIDMHVSGSPIHRVVARDGMPLSVSACCLKKRGGPPSIDLLDTTAPLKITRWTDSPWCPAKVRA